MPFRVVKLKLSRPDLVEDRVRRRQCEDRSTHRHFVTSPGHLELQSLGEAEKALPVQSLV